MRVATATLVDLAGAPALPFMLTHTLAYWWNHFLLPGAEESVEPGWCACGPPTWEGTLCRE